MNAKRKSFTAILIALVPSCLLLDYLFFSDEPWSASRFVSQEVVGLVAVFFSAIGEPANSNVVQQSVFAICLVILGGVLLWRSALLAGKLGGEAATPSDRAPSRRRFGLATKLSLKFCAVGLLFVVGTWRIVNGFYLVPFEHEIKRRAEVVALGLSELIAQHLAANGEKQIAAEVERYGSAKAVAYVFVEEASGRIVARTPAGLELTGQRDFPKSAERALKGVNLKFAGAEVFEIAKPIDEGKSGYVHLAIWRAAIAEDARLAVAPVAGSILVALLGITVLFVLRLRGLCRPLRDLIEPAEKISRGDFAAILDLKREDEIGELARSIDRMRSSLGAAMRRFDPSKPAVPERPNQKTAP
ncbi:MAG: HAMP domain-containing protein [Deltaproteobacteria bacterium]|nr:HAMP domain-containing protein [Deltaproteobacteria bacterium]